MRLISIIVLLVGFSFGIQAQPNDQQLAAHYFNKGEYEKAELYYEKLYDKQPSENFYNFYFKTLLALEKYKDAEKLVKKHSRRNSNSSWLLLDLAEIEKLRGNPERAHELYEEAINDVPESSGYIIKLGKAFQERGELEYALKTYQKGKKSIKNYPFAFRTAEIYGKLGQTEKMIEDYLEVVNEHDSYMVSVQTALNRLLDFEDPDNPSTELLRVTLLQQIQKHPNNIVYTEMLIWYFIQVGDFKSALRQTIAMDKRIRNGFGVDVLQISRMCRANREYETALDGYDYVIETYKDSPNSTRAKMEQMETLYEKVTSSRYTQEDLLNLEKRYEESLSEEELGRNASSVNLMINLAHVEGFYLYNYQKAIDLLNEVIEMPGVSRHYVGRAKLKLGDIQLVSGDPWAASLNYLQVEKMFKEDILGHEAKFKTAKVFYYKGQFEYAQSMLDVLKASTSKLIANDAMELSLLITDNSGLDTTARPMMLFAQADLLIYQNKFDQAFETMDSLRNEFGYHKLSDEVLYKKYQIELKRQNYQKCAEHLKQILEFYAEDILGDNATFALGELYHYYLNDEAKAKEYYKKILFEYEGSIFTVEARKRFRKLGGQDPDSFKKIIKDENDG